jgi:NAD-dependent DNA ligase
VVSDLRPPDSLPLVIPTSCPSCGTRLVPRADSGDPGNLVCPNTWGCPAQQAAGVQHFVSQCVGKGLGSETVEKLRAAGVVTTIADLFKITEVRRSAAVILIRCQTGNNNEYAQVWCVYDDTSGKARDAWLQCCIMAPGLAPGVEQLAPMQLKWRSLGSSS